MIRNAILTIAAVVLALSVAPLACADFILSTPAGLAPGSTFQIVFVTDVTTTATSSSITTYNSFVNTQAGIEA